MPNRFQIPIRCAALIDAPVGSVRRALGTAQVWSRAARAVGGHLRVAGDPVRMKPGCLVRFEPGRGAAVLLRAVQESGPPVLRSAVPGGLAVGISVVTASTAAGTLTTVEFVLSSPIPLLGNMFRPILVRYGEMLLGIATLVAREPVRVVAGAVIQEGKVLLARRTSPPGKWELPGGKVEPGESDRQALGRELSEELALHTKVSDRIGPVVEIEPGMILICYRAEMVRAGQSVVLSDHDEYRWVGPAELEQYDLLQSDRQLLDSLRTTLHLQS